jgi:hypothetical protein
MTSDAWGTHVRLSGLGTASIAATTGTGLGLVLRVVPNSGGWLIALLALSAAVVGLAQQTLP